MKFVNQPGSRGRSKERTMAKQADFSTRGSKTGKTRRMRVYSLHDDQVEIIKDALEKARQESETQYDSVALTNICMHYLAT
jgi:fatty acid-binding protein DegV